MDSNNTTIIKALKDIVVSYGVEILTDVNRANALLKDYIPHYEKERKLLVLALKEGIGADLQSAIESNQTEQFQLIAKWERRLVTDNWITEEAAHLVVSQLTIALGISGRDSFRESTNASSEKQECATKELLKGTYQEDVKPETYLNEYQIIGYKAFASNSHIEAIRISDSILQIKSKAFFNCINLKSIVIPSSVKQIGRKVFFGCRSLEEISTPNTGTYCCKEGLLINNSAHELLRVTTQRDNECARIPEGIQIIQECAFDGSIVKSVILPSNLRVIQHNAFYQCDNLGAFEISSMNPSFKVVDGVLHTKDGKKLLLFPAGAAKSNYILEDAVCEIAKSAFEGAKALKSITFPSSLVRIGERAFADCRALSSVILPASVAFIGERAFQGCIGLQYIMLPRGIQEIGDCAFNGCKSMETISVPRSVARIGNRAFYGCNGLKKVVIQDQVSYIGDGAFDDCSQDIEIAIRNNPRVELYCRMRGIKFSKL